MRRPSYHFLTCFVVVAATVLFAVSTTFAQKDTVEFKFIPKYYPDEGRFVEGPPVELASKPEIVFPTDPKLQGEEAMVWIKAKVDRQGSVHNPDVLKSTDERFNVYAIKYARQYKFRWPQGWPEDLKDQKTLWLSFNIKFSQQR
jgi:outer membrane biosynthesis protein TonB